MSNYVTAIGLDVHARSITACPLNPMTGGVSSALLRLRPRVGRRVGPQVRVAEGGHESGVTGFHLCRALRRPRPRLRRQGPSRRCSARPPTAAARLTAATPSSSPACSRRATSSGSGCPTSALRRPATSRAGRRARRPAARQEWMSKFLLRHGHVFDLSTPTGGRRGQLDAGVLEVGRRGRVRRARRRRRLRALPRLRAAAGGARRAGEEGRRGPPGGRRKPAVDAQVREGRRRRHRVPARLRDGRPRLVPERAVVRLVVRARALGHSSGETSSRGRITRAQRPRAPRARRVRLARPDVLATRPSRPARRSRPRCGATRRSATAGRRGAGGRSRRRQEADAWPTAPRRGMRAGCGR